MKSLRLFVIVAALIATGFVTLSGVTSSTSPALVSPAAAATAVPTLAPQDVTGINGVYPYFPNGMFTDPYGQVFRTVTDSTASSPAAVGKLLYFTGSTWIQAATANLALPRGLYGVVVTAASAQGGSAVIQTSGLATASVKTGGTYACAATGDAPLASTTTGDLTPTAAASTPGVTLGACASVLAVSQSATLISIFIGGY